jgi:capsular polysaccharide biosynthesis protein
LTDSGFYLRALRRGWWLALLVVLAAVAVAWVLSSRGRPLYRASASLVATPSTEIVDPGDALDAIETLERRTIVATFAKIPSAPEVRESAARRMGVEPREIRYYWIGASVLPNTNVIRIDVVGPDPDRAAEVADAVAAATRREARSLYGVFTLRRLAGAQPAREPERPDPPRAAAVAGVLGLFLGALAALALEAFRSRSR